MQNTNRTPVRLFVAAFAILAGIMLVQSFKRQQVTYLDVKDNKGTSFLETAGDSLVCIFQDGRTCVWDWAEPHAMQGDFQAASARAVVIDNDRLAAVTSSGRKTLTIHSLPDGGKRKAFSVGYEDQDVWLKVSFDKSAAAVIRRNPADAAGRTLYEFLTIDFESELLGLPASLSVNEKTETLVDYAVDSGHIFYAVGSRNKTGRIAAINLETGSILWDRVFEDTKEFCSVTDSPDGQYLLAGDRNGLLYRIDASSGEPAEQITLLETGEMRPITNDYSVLNLAFSPDGQYYAATINPPAYILQSGTNKLIHRLSPADKVVSKIAFSPDSRAIATSDLRAGYPVKVHSLPEKE